MANHAYCNGKYSSSPAEQKSVARNKMASENMNWLLFTMFAREDFTFCKNLIQHQLKLNYDKEYLFHVQGLIQRAEDKPQEALVSFRAAVESNPKNSDNYKELAKTLYQLGRHKQALEMFIKAEALLQRVDPEVYFYLGDLVARNVGNPKTGLAEAKEYFKRAILNGKHRQSYYKLAEVYTKEKEYGKAIEMYENCLHVSEETADLLTEVGLLYLKLNEQQRALEKLLDATHADDQHKGALAALGAILQTKGDVDGALNRYKMIKNVQNESGEVWNNIGMCFYRKRKYVAAIACLKKAAWLSPLNFNVLFNLGLVLLSIQQYASAFQKFAAAVNLRPNHAECYMLIGICLRFLDDQQNAYLAFERSIMSPEAIRNPAIYLNFALYCYEMEKSEQALLHLNNFLELSQNVDISRENLAMAEVLRQKLGGSHFAVPARATPSPVVHRDSNSSIEAQPGSRGQVSETTDD